MAYKLHKIFIIDVFCLELELMAMANKWWASFLYFIITFTAPSIYNHIQLGEQLVLNFLFNLGGAWKESHKIRTIYVKYRHQFTF